MEKTRIKVKCINAAGTVLQLNKVYNVSESGNCYVISGAGVKTLRVAKTRFVQV